MKAPHQTLASGCVVHAANGSSAIYDLSFGLERHGDCVITPPNSSVMFAECAAIPVLTASLAPGRHWLCCAAIAGDPAYSDMTSLPEVLLDNETLTVRHVGQPTALIITL